MRGKLRMVSKDVFLSTRATWLGRKLAGDEDSRREVNRYIMDVYREPLRIYFLGIQRRGQDDAEDMVEGFFADRLGKESFLRGWQDSGLPLRRWLMNSFCFFLQEQRRRKRRDDFVRRGGEVPQDILDPSPSAEQAMDRSYAVAMVREALSRTAEQCQNAGLEQHWHIFLLHHLEGKSYRDLESLLKIPPHRASVMARTVRRKFARVFADLFGKEGVPGEGIDQEIRALLEAIDS